MDPAVLSMVIAVAGWIVVHVLGIHARNQQFRQTVVNSARREVTDSFRAYQSWLSKVHAMLASASLFLEIEDELKLAISWTNRRDDWQGLFFDARKIEWSFRLEEYLILFPYADPVRVELVERQRVMDEQLVTLARCASYLAIQVNAELRQQVKTILSSGLKTDLLEQSHLIEDLRIVLQNRMLSEVVDQAIPLRSGPNPDVLRVVQGNDGNLHLGTAADAP